MISRKFASVGATGSSCPAFLERGDIVIAPTREIRRCLYRVDTYRRIYAPLFVIDGETTKDLQDQAQDTCNARLVRFGASAIRLVGGVTSVATWLRLWLMQSASDVPEATALGVARCLSMCRAGATSILARKIRFAG